MPPPVLPRQEHSVAAPVQAKPHTPGLTRLLWHSLLWILFLYLLTVGLSLLLSSSMLRTFSQEHILQVYSNASTEMREHIERGLRFGRPLTGYSGLEKQLRQRTTELEALHNMAVYSMDARLLYSAQKEDATDISAILTNQPKLAPSGTWLEHGAYWLRLEPLHGGGTQQQGWLLAEVLRHATDAEYQRFLWRALPALLLLVLCGCLAQTGWMAFIHSSQACAKQRRRLFRRSIFTFTGGAQLLFVAVCLYFFSQSLYASLQQAAQVAGRSFVYDLEFLVEKNVHISTLPGLHAQLSRIQEHTPGVSAVAIAMPNAPTVLQGTATERSVILPVYRYWPDRYSPKEEVATVQLFLDPQFAHKAITRLALDLASIVLISLLILHQATALLSRMLFPDVSPQTAQVMEHADQQHFLGVSGTEGTAQATAAQEPAIAAQKKSAQQAHSPQGQSPPESGSPCVPSAMPSSIQAQAIQAAPPAFVMQPPMESANGMTGAVINMVMFIYFFAYDMVISFIPLVSATQAGSLPLVPASLLPGLPISAEAISSALGLLLAGVMAQQKSAKSIFARALFLSCAGAVLAACSWHIGIFILSRGLAGLGFGMILMAGQLAALQQKEHKVASLASLYAALFSGSLCGSAIGGMAYDLFGARYIFGAVAGILALSFLLLPLLQHQPLSARPTRLLAMGSLIRFKAFLVPVLLVSIPSAMCLTGFLYLSVPMQLQQQGVLQADIGRLFMLYGLCFILVGPFIASYTEQYSSQRFWAGTAGGAAALALLCAGVWPHYAGYAVAVVLIGISQCLLAASMLVYILSLPLPPSIDPAMLSSAYRLCERLGQIIGPVVFGLMATRASHGFILLASILGGGALLFYLVSRSATTPQGGAPS